MDQLSADQQREIKKTGSERLRDGLIKAGYDEDSVSSYDRNALMNAFAQLFLTPSPVEPQGATGGVEAGYPEQPEQTNYNPAEETELDLRRRELMLREKEMRMRKKELELREKELERQKEKDEEEEKRKESLAGQTRFYGDALKHSLPKMGNDPTEFPAYFRAVENLFTLFEVRIICVLSFFYLC